MKTIILNAAIIFSTFITCTAQQTRDAQIPAATKPVYNPFQLPNYYQNNSSFINNSMQTNPPQQNAGSYSGNGTYVDPTRNPAGTYLGNTSNQQPGNGPVNSANSNAVNSVGRR